MAVNAGKQDGHKTDFIAQHYLLIGFDFILIINKLELIKYHFWQIGMRFFPDPTEKIQTMGHFFFTEI